MKRHILFGGMLLMAAAFTACTEDFTDWAQPINNPQPDAITIPGLTASAAAASFDLATDADVVQLVSLSSATLPEGTSLGKMRLYIAPAGVEDVEEKIITAVSAADGTFEKETLQELVVSNFGPRPTARAYNAHVYLDGIYNGQAAYIDAGAVQLNLIPEAPQISDNYYIVGGALDWAGSAASKAQKFNHSGADVYEDPAFSIVIDAADGDTWFAIGDDEACDAITNDGDWSKLFGTTLGNGESGTEGTLDRRYNLKDDGSFKVPAGSKKIKVEINMMDRTYKITPVAFEQAYYLTGSINGWNNTDTSYKLTNDGRDIFENPTFTCRIPAPEDGSNVEFKMTPESGLGGDWSGCLAAGEREGTFVYNNAGGNLVIQAVEGAVFYDLTFNMLEETWSYNALFINIEPAYYFTGSINGWNNTDTSYKLTNDGRDPYENPTFTCRIPAPEDGSNVEFKMTPESGLGGNWSGCLAAGPTEGTFVYNNGGGNLVIQAVEGAKFYDLTFNMMELTWSYKAINFNPFIYFIGATDGWSAADQKLAHQGDGLYTGYVYCADPNNWGNDFKFQRTQGQWDDELNYESFTGGVTGNLAQGGGTNFNATAGEGVYYVTLDLANLKLNAIKVNNMNLVGDFNGWNPADDAQQMTWDAANYCFVITGAKVTANGWKFTINNSWDVNLGGDTLNDLVANGANITAVGTTIKLYPTRKTSDKIYCTVD